MGGADWQSHVEFMSQKKPLYRLPLAEFILSLSKGYGYDVPHGREAKPSSNKPLTWKFNNHIIRPAPFPLRSAPKAIGKGTGDRSLFIIYH